MLEDNYKLEIDDNGFDIQSSSSIDKYIEQLSNIGIYIKDIDNKDNRIVFIPFSPSICSTKKPFLKNMGFEFKSDKLFRDLN